MNAKDSRFQSLYGKFVAIFIILWLTAGCQSDNSLYSVVTAEPTFKVESTIDSSTEESITPTTQASPTSVTNANADVEFVRAEQDASGLWTFHVTVRHPDTGWEDYADGWNVVTSDGNVLTKNPEDQFTRLLLHPHETEQPFTRSQNGLMIPDSVTYVIVKAHDLVDGFGGKEVRIDLNLESGPGFEVHRN